MTKPNASRTAAVPRAPSPSFEAKYNELVRDTSSDNWDDEGGRAIPQARWTFLLSVYEKASAELSKLPAPHPSASGDGTMYLRWVSNGCVFDAEFAPNGRVYWAYRNGERSDKGETGSPAALLERLREAFA